MGLGGSLRAASTSRTALEVALQATTAAGAHARLVWVRDLDLPLYTADLPVPRPVRESPTTAAAHFDDVALSAFVSAALVVVPPAAEGVLPLAMPREKEPDVVPPGGLDPVGAEALFAEFPEADVPQCRRAGCARPGP